MSNLLPKKANLRPERTRSALSGRQGGVGTTMKLIQTGLLTKMAMRMRIVAMILTMMTLTMTLISKEVGEVEAGRI